MNVLQAQTTVRASGSDRQPNGSLERLADGLAVIALVMSGAIFGFFYAWVCSTMWGLDNADPRTAIEAMQAMNASVRNAVFFPSFFLTPVVFAVVGAMMRWTGRPIASRWFLTGGALYFVGALLVTAMINVPMNEELATVSNSLGKLEAADVWSVYSGRWQMWNTVRTVVSGVALVLGVIGLRTSAVERLARR